MLVFIDESGCPGLDPGSSTPFFTITLVVFEDYEEAEATERTIAELRSRLRFREDFEFHFSKLKAAFRAEFLKAVGVHEFFYFSVTINKSRLNGPEFKYPDSFYKYACGLAFENAKPYLRDAIVVIDGSGGREFRNQLSSYLGKRVTNADGIRLIRKVKIQDSKRNSLIQMADMVCGAVARSYSKKEDAMDYRRLISHREMSRQFWPK